MRRLLLSLVSFIPAFTQAAEETRLLAAIAQVETGNNPAAVGDRGQSLGRFQMGPTAWADANDWLARRGRRPVPRSSWRNPAAQDIAAKAFLGVCRERFAALGITDPSPAQLATVWNLGFQGARQRGFRPTDYGLRVSNLYFAR
jgi:hypothetical protein